jgi:hypothetical protein
VVQQLADRDALGEGRGVAVEIEQPLRDEPKHEGAYEDLGHAADAEAVVRREGLAGTQIGEARRCLDRPIRPDGSHDGARNPGRDNSVELKHPAHLVTPSAVR